MEKTKVRVKKSGLENILKVKRVAAASYKSKPKFEQVTKEWVWFGRD